MPPVIDLRLVNVDEWNRWRQTGGSRETWAPDLRNADLRGRDLRSADFARCDLSHAKLDGAVMDKVSFVDAVLVGASLDRSSIRGADFRHALLKDASLAGMQSCCEAVFSFANLTGATFRGNLCDQVDFRYAILDSVDFQNCDLQGSLFDDYGLSKLEITTARSFLLAQLPEDIMTLLRDAGFTVPSSHNLNVKTRTFKAYDFSNIDLRGADFSQANLESARFNGAKLETADFRAARVQFADFRGATGLLPDQIRPAKNWPLALLNWDPEIRSSAKKPKVNRRGQGRSAPVEITPVAPAAIEARNLSSVFLSGADLSDATLAGFNLKKANLHGCDLTRANLAGANLSLADCGSAQLREVVLERANLEGAILDRASLEGAKLNKAELSRASMIRVRARGASFSDANLHRVRLAHANLRDADLSTARGLHAWQLSGADLTNAKLPAEIQKFEATSALKECMEKAGKVFTLLIVACVTSSLTVLNTSPAELRNPKTLLNVSGLSAMQVPVPVFGWFMPMLLAAVMIYYQVQLRSVWVELSTLPAFFPDGRALHRRAYPWLMTTLVSAALPLLREKLPRLFLGAELIVCIAVNWFLVPTVLCLIWYRYLELRMWSVTLVQIAIVSLSTFVAIYAIVMAWQTLREGWKQDSLILRKRTALAGALAFFLSLLLAFATFMISLRTY